MSDTNDNSQPNRQRDTKISDFVGTTTLQDADLVTVVQNGVNKKITRQAFSQQMGVTGTIEQDGAITGVPVLDKQGSENFIRNLEAGPGISVSLSPENGITIEHNFQSGTGGSPILTNETTASPTIRSIAAGDGISVSPQNGSLVIAATTAPPTTGLVIVNSVADLPTPVGDVITLDASATYYLQGLINLEGNRLIAANGVEIFSDNRLTRGFTTTNVGAMITIDGADAVVIRECLLITSGSRFDVKNAGTLIVNNCLGIQSSVSDTFTDTGNVSFRNFSLFDFGGGVEGWSWAGNCAEFNMDNSFVSGYTATALDFGTAVFDRGLIIGSGNRFSGSVGSIAIDGAANSANIDVGSAGLVLGNKNTGDGTFLGGNITKKDTRWAFRDNQGVGNSVILGAMGLSGNVVDTVLSTGVFVQVAGTQVAADNIERCTVNGSDQLEFTNEQEACGLAVATLDVTRIGSGTNNYLFAIFKNGVQVELTSGVSIQQNIEVSATDTQISLLAPVCFKEGDMFDVRINRQGGTADLLVTDMVMTIR